MKNKSLSTLLALFITSAFISPLQAQETPEEIVPTVIDLLTKGCDSHGVGEACALLSQAFYDGLGVELNYVTSLHYSTKGCEKVDNPSGIACYLAAQDYENEVFFELDYEKAHALYDKGCELDNSDSCWNVAYNFENGYGVKENSRQANKFYRKACDLGDQDACDEL